MDRGAWRAIVHGVAKRATNTLTTFQACEESRTCDINKRKLRSEEANWQKTQLSELLDKNFKYDRYIFKIYRKRWIGCMYFPTEVGNIKRETNTLKKKQIKILE